jgi:hypothetical protein
MRIESRLRHLEQRLAPAECVVVLCYGQTPEEQRAECERQAAAHPEAGLVCVLTNARVC